MSASVDVVVPTIGRASLPMLLAALDGPPSSLPARVILVDDRRAPAEALDLGAISPELRERLDVLATGGRGPAAARNRGWRASRADWVAFLDDDVVPCRGWLTELRADLANADDGVAGIQGRVGVPMPTWRAPTDRERGVRGLETARWASADVAYRTSALRAVGGFDERFPRAYREDADLGLRLVARGFRIAAGRRSVVHPVWPASRWASLRAQRGNRDDALMRALHGRGWRRAAHAPAGRLPAHVATTAAAAVACVAAIAGHGAIALAALAAWAVATAQFAWSRIAPGPRTREEVVTMIVTSLAIPPLATWHRLAGEVAVRRAPPRAGAPPPGAPVEAVLFDRDGTLVADVPANRDPDAVRPLAGAREAVLRLRAAGVRLGVVTNQDAVGEGRLGADDLRAVNARIDALVGPFDAWLVCPHAPGDGCACRKPAPGLVRRALRALGVMPERCAFLGDTAADMAAARAAGVRPILVPNAVTRREEIAEASEVARDLVEAVDRLLGARR
jgi:histidinol-phosphate phosphatase family protein